MRTVVDPDVEAWVIEKPDLEWDTGNTQKLAKHKVSHEEVADIFREVAVFVGRIVDPPHNEPRWLLLGHTGEGRHLALIFTQRGEKLRPISCRPMRQKERRFYEAVLGEEEDDESAH